MIIVSLRNPVLQKQFFQWEMGVVIIKFRAMKLFFLHNFKNKTFK